RSSMTRETALDSIFRLVDSDKVKKNPDDKIVIVNSSGKVLPKKSILSGRLRFYLVTPDVTVDFRATPVNLTSRSRTRDSLEVRVICQVSCAKGNEEALVP